MRHRRSNSTALASRLIGLSLAVPQVVGHRVARMSLAGASPSQRDRREFHRMSAEKAAAFHESWNAMLLEAFRAHLRLSMSLWFWWSPLAATKPPLRRAADHIRRTQLAILAKGMAPIHRRAVANAKRLSRVRMR